MLDELFFPFRFPTWNVPSAPAGVTYSNEKLTMELPGVTPDNCKVTVLDKENTLRIEYRKRGTDFRQEFLLPRDIDLEHVQASLQNGLLEIALPRQQEKVRQITLSDKPLLENLDKSA